MAGCGEKTLVYVIVIIDVKIHTVLYLTCFHLYSERENVLIHAAINGFGSDILHSGSWLV